MKNTALAGALLLLLGCSVNEPFVPLEKEPYLASLEAAEPLPQKVAIAPVVVDFDPQKTNASSSSRFAMRPDLNRLARFVDECVRRATLFSNVIGVEGKSVEERIERAWGKDADVLLVPHLARYEVFYAGANSLYIWNVVNWIFLWVPSWWLRDEIYGVGGTFDLKFYSTHSGRLLHTERVSFEARLSLDDFQRGWRFLGIFTVPGSLSESNWRKIERTLRERTDKEMKLALLKALNESTRAALRAAGALRMMGKRVVAVVGVSRYKSPRLPPLSFAADDASMVHRVLSEAASSRVERRNVHLLSNDSATRAAFLSLLAEMVRRSQSADELIVYFAGYGMRGRTRMTETDRGAEVVAGMAAAVARSLLGLAVPPPPALHKEVARERRYILLYDSEPGKPETAVALNDVAGLLSRARAAKVVLMVDAGFGVERECRGASSAPQSAPLYDRPIRDFTTRPGRLFVSACRHPCEGAAEFDHHRHGVFTHYLLAGLGGAADRNRDGTVTLKEAFAYAYPRVLEETQMEGCAQYPEMLGEGAQEVILHKKVPR